LAAFHGGVKEALALHEDATGHFGAFAFEVFGDQFVNAFPVAPGSGDADLFFGGVF